MPCDESKSKRELAGYDCSLELFPLIVAAGSNEEERLNFYYLLKTRPLKILDKKEVAYYENNSYQPVIQMETISRNGVQFIIALNDMYTINLFAVRKQRLVPVEVGRVIQPLRK